MAEPRRILLVRLSHLGDAVHALPLFHALRERYPDAEIGWAIQPEFAGLLRGMEGLERIFEFDRRGGLSAWTRLVPQLRSWQPDLAIDCQGNLKSAAVTRFSGAPRRVGYDASDWREPLGALALTERSPATAPDRRHALDRVESLTRHIVPSAAWRTDPGLTPAEMKRGETLWRDLDPGPAPVVLHLSAERDIRSWPLSSFVELARRLHASGRSVLVLSGPSEEAEGQQVQRALSDLPAIRHSVGQRGIRELASLMTVAAGRESTLVACDSGPMHLAVACGLRVLCLSGPQDPKRTGPHSLEPAGHASLRAEAPPACAPCLARRCAHADGPICMSRIEVESVLRQLDSMRSEPVLETRSRQA